MNERDKELAAEAEAYADYDFKGEVYWREAYEAKLIDLIRADEREACAKMCEQPIDEIQITDTISDVVYMDAHECAAGIRARGNT